MAKWKDRIGAISHYLLLRIEAIDFCFVLNDGTATTESTVIVKSHTHTQSYLALTMDFCLTLYGQIEQQR